MRLRPSSTAIWVAFGPHRDPHEVAADGAALALAAPALRTVLVEIERFARRRWRSTGLGAARLAGPTSASAAPVPPPPLPRPPPRPGSTAGLGRRRRRRPRPGRSGRHRRRRCRCLLGLAAARRLVGVWRRRVAGRLVVAPGAGRVSPIWGRRTSAFSAASADFGLALEDALGQLFGAAVARRAVGPDRRPRWSRTRRVGDAVRCAATAAGRGRAVPARRRASSTSVPSSAVGAPDGCGSVRPRGPRRRRFVGGRVVGGGPSSSAPGSDEVASARPGSGRAVRRRARRARARRGNASGVAPVGAGSGGLGVVDDRIGHGRVPFS